MAHTQKYLRNLFLSLTIIFIFYSCNNSEESTMGTPVNIIFLHHSTGGIIWKGGLSGIARRLGFDGDVRRWFNNFNKRNEKNYLITEASFPKETPYGWRNDPYDYYNIWVENAGNKPYKEEPTLEMLTGKYNVIVFKHCFPVSNIEPDTTAPDIKSVKRTLGNYKLQYNALKEKMHQFPKNKFIVWTPPAQVKSNTNEEEAIRAQEFSNWVKLEWDIKGDNIFIWDFRELETEGSLYLKDSYADSPTNSHPGKNFAEHVAPYFCQRIVDVIEGRGDSSSLTGK
jgi:hypothetical protein